MTTYSDLLTKIEPIDLGYIIDSDKPVLPYWKQVTNAMCSAPHCHPRGQFIFSVRGITRVVTDDGIFLIPPSQAFWCPPNVTHELVFSGAVDIANLFIDPAWVYSLPLHPQIFNVSALVNYLVKRSMQMGCDYKPNGKEYRLMLVLLDEISVLDKSLLALPWSNRDKLNAILCLLVKEPCNIDTIDQWAESIHVSPRTLARMFQKELGMTFTEWRMRIRLFYAIEQLHAGKSVTYIALELGYSTPSAFIVAFRKIMDKSPLEYIVG